MGKRERKRGTEGASAKERALRTCMTISLIQCFRLKNIYILFAGYTGILVSRTFDLSNLPISRTKTCFPWICFPDFSNSTFVPLGSLRNHVSTVDSHADILLVRHAISPPQ